MCSNAKSGSPRAIREWIRRNSHVLCLGSWAILLAAFQNSGLPGG